MSRVQSIERAFDVLGALGDGPLGVTGIADRVGLPKSTVARLLAALAGEGAVEQAPGGTDYRIGERLVTLAAGVNPTAGLVALSRPHLAALAEATGEASGLSIPDGTFMHYLHHEDSLHPVAIRDWTGTRFPMHSVSAGIVLLAHRPDAEVDRLLATPLERLTPATEVDPARLRARIARARADGVAWTRGEAAEGITSCAAAILDATGDAVGAVHVHGPSYRFPDPEDPAREPSVGLLVRDAAARIGERLSRARGRGR